ncbi:glycosyl transferase family 25 [Rhizobium sp. Root1203]|nr:glycosyl transferase family 25 [Rhizobium sp. Root1203]
MTISNQARLLGISVNRVAGVDGRQIPETERQGFDAREFQLRNGRALLPGEYGCYRAHIMALEIFLASGHQSAVIMEDDVALTENVLERAAAILRVLPTADVVKLLNHRAKGYRSVVVTEFGDDVGRCMFGPQGSAACYLVTRQGARKLLENGQTIRFPYDMELERGWSTATNVYTVKRNIIGLSAHSLVTDIADRRQYRAVKQRGPRRVATHLMRALEFVNRLKYALS